MMHKVFIIIAGVIALTIVGAVLFIRSSETPAEETSTPRVIPEPSFDYTIIGFGDSLTAGYGLPLTESYPAQLEQRLREAGYAVRVINAGVSGETTRGNRERATFIRTQNPDIVLLGIGGNDALRFLPLAETEINLRAILEILSQGPDAPHIVLLQMQAPLNAGPEYKKEFDVLYTTLATEYALPLVPFITEEIFLDPSLKLEDGIHLNKSGYGRIVDTYLIPAITPILKAQDAKED